MKYVAIALGLGLVLSASAQANEDLEAKCWFGSHGKNATQCKARAELDLNGSAPADVSAGVQPRIELEVECNNGFEIKDYRATFAAKDNDLWVIAEDRQERDDVAVIEAIDVLNRDTSGGDFKAELIIASDGHAKRLNGKCEVEFDR
jgi:hypothetical protein